MNLRLVVAFAKRMYRPELGVSFPDLVQEGNLGLMKAVERFDPAQGRFSTYAAWWIRQAMKRAVTETGCSVRIPVHVQDGLAHVALVESELSRGTGSRPAGLDVAAYMGVEPAVVERLRLTPRRAVSLDAPVRPDNEDGDTWGARLPDADAVDPEQGRERTRVSPPVVDGHASRAGRCRAGRVVPSLRSCGPGGSRPAAGVWLPIPGSASAGWRFVRCGSSRRRRTRSICACSFRLRLRPERAELSLQLRHRRGCVRQAEQEVGRHPQRLRGSSQRVYAHRAPAILDLRDSGVVKPFPEGGSEFGLVQPCPLSAARESLAEVSGPNPGSSASRSLAAWFPSSILPVYRFFSDRFVLPDSPTAATVQGRSSEKRDSGVFSAPGAPNRAPEACRTAVIRSRWAGSRQFDAGAGDQVPGVIDVAPGCRTCAADARPLRASRRRSTPSSRRCPATRKRRRAGLRQRSSPRDVPRRTAGTGPETSWSGRPTAARSRPSAERSPAGIPPLPARRTAPPRAQSARQAHALRHRVCLPRPTSRARPGP